MMSRRWLSAVDQPVSVPLTGNLYNDIFKENKTNFFSKFFILFFSFEQKFLEVFHFILKFWTNYCRSFSAVTEKLKVEDFVSR